MTPISASRLVITRSVNIECPGLVIQSTSTFTSLIEINIAPDDPLREVFLKDFTVSGFKGNSNFGIHIKSAARVTLERMTIGRALNVGVYDQRSGGQTRLFIKDSLIHVNGGPGITAASQSPASTVLDNVSLLNNNYGLAVATGNNVVVTRSTISGNTTAGMHADGGAQVNVSNSTLSHNTAHVNAYGTVRLKENEIQFSNVAVQGSGARSLGANRFAGNVTLGSAPPLVSGAPADVYD